MNDQEQTTEIALLKQEQKTMSQKLDDVKETVINGFAVIKKDMQDFKNDCNNNYVSKETFNPIKSIVY